MIRKPLTAVVVALAVLTLTGCHDDTGYEDDTDYECEYVTQLSPMYIGKNLYMMPYQQCFLVQKEAK